MTTTRFARSAAFAAVLALATVACAAPGGGPSQPPSFAAPTSGPTLRPSPTPVGAPASTAAEAAALVIAQDPRFAGTTEFDPELIGASQYWKATPRDAGGWTIELTMGWGDCPAGCIERHVWTYVVTPDGAVTLVSESGDPVPSDLPA